MQLQFFDNAKIDARARKQIRSQVMQGKNAGKKRQRVKYERKKLPVLTSKSLENNDTFSKGAYAGVIAPRHWDEFSTFTYPSELDCHLRRNLKAFMMSTTDIIYPKELCFDVAGSHTIFFQLFQSDEAFFHCLLALAEGQRYLLTGAEGVSDLTLHCLASTYRCINRDLEKNQIPSYGTAASVMSLTMHENLFGMTGKSRLHLHALERIVELKGGLQAFERYTALLHKICRSDLEYALQVGARPRFHRDAFPRTEVIKALAESSLCSAYPIVLEDDAIREVFDDCISVSCILNGDGTGDKLNPFSFQEILISIASRLLHAYPLDTTGPTNKIDSACQLALLALVTTMLIRGGPHHQEYYHLLAAKLRDAILELGPSNLQFRFWVCYVASLSVLNNDKERGWLAPMIRSLASELGISTYQQARAVLMRFPWVRFFHDEAGEQCF